MDADLNNEEEAYEVESIEKHRKEKDGTLSYLIKWLGYDKSQNSWTPEANMNSPDILKEYWKRVEKKRNSSIKKEKSTELFSSRRKTRDSENSENDIEIKRQRVTRSSSRNISETSEDIKINNSTNNQKITRRVTESSHLQKRISPPLPRKRRSVEKNKIDLVEESNVDVASNELTPSTSSTSYETDNRVNFDNVTLRKRGKRVKKLFLSDSSESEEYEKVTENENFDFSPNSEVSTTLSEKAKKASLKTINNERNQDQADFYMENLNGTSTKSGLEKGWKIHRILQIGIISSVHVALIKYEEHDIWEWVSVELVKQNDINALIQFYEDMYRFQMKIDEHHCENPLFS